MGKNNHDPIIMVYIELNHAPIPYPVPHPDQGSV